MTRRIWIRSGTLLVVVLTSAAAFAGWKQSSLAEADAAWANQPEPMELVNAATAQAQEYRPAVTTIGTVLALRSVTLSNEVPGSVRTVNLDAGEVVPAGTVLVALDVSVEKAELKAQAARALLAETRLERMQNLHKQRAVSQEDVDQARAERDIAKAEVERIKAIIDRKTIRAPFRARVGIANVHPGQYLASGTVLTTLQSVENAMHVDFPVPQQTAANLHEGQDIEVLVEGISVPASIVAVDSRVDPATRNAMVRARIDNTDKAPSPGASVRVKVPDGEPRHAIAIPVAALRRGPSGDHVFVLQADEQGQLRAQHRSVETGPIKGDKILIVNGLEAGESVATSGSFKLRESVLVAIKNDNGAVTAADGSL